MKSYNTFYFSQIHGQAGYDFMDRYAVEKEIVFPGKKPYLLAKEMRICRFCERKYPETHFSDDSHMFSEMLGNRHLIADFECDDCNRVFNKYETDLSYFLGVNRTIHKVKGKKGVPAFKSSGGGIRADRKDFLGLKNIIEISRENADDNSMEMDQQSGKGVVRFRKQSYIPMNVYKAFLKMALSCISKEDEFYYRYAIDSLLSEKYDAPLAGLAKVIAFEMPFDKCFTETFAVLYKKKERAAEMPVHVFVLYFRNIIYKIFLPLHRRDITYCKNYKTYWCPPLFLTEDDAATIPVIAKIYNLSSKEMLRGEQQELHFQLERSQLANPAVFNLEKKEFVDNPVMGKPMRFILTEPGDSISIDQLKSF